MDTFFSQTNCDRCGKSLNGGRITSWFTEETICMDCKEKENETRRQLFENGSRYEGCGYVPNPKLA
jgi:hypothetical protein